MKVMVVETDAAGGLIHFAYQLAEGFAGIGAETTLLTGTHYELADLPHHARVAPILRLWSPVEELPAGGFGRWWHTRISGVRRGFRAARLAREWLRLVRHVRRERPDIVVFSMIRFPFLSLYLRSLRRSGIRLAQVCHEFQNRESQSRNDRPARSAFPDLYGQFDRIFFLSRSALAEFRSIHPEHAGRTQLLPHGPELIFKPDDKAFPAIRARYRIRQDERIALMFGGLRPSKGVPDLIRAFARLRGTPRTRLIVAGYPSREFDQAEVTGLVRDLKLDDQVTLDFRYVPMSELGALVRRADVIAFPYRSATSSGALALAQTEGRPILATAVGGLVDVVRDGVTGRLVPFGDPAAMGFALQDLLDDPQRAADMAAAAQREIMESRSWPSIAQRILDAFSGSAETAT